MTVQVSLDLGDRKLSKTALRHAVDAERYRLWLDVLPSLTRITFPELLEQVDRLQPTTEDDPLARMGIGPDIYRAILDPVRDHPAVNEYAMFSIQRAVQHVVCTRELP